MRIRDLALLRYKFLCEAAAYKSVINDLRNKEIEGYDYEDQIQYSEDLEYLKTESVQTCMTFQEQYSNGCVTLGYISPKTVQDWKVVYMPALNADKCEDLISGELYTVEYDDLGRKSIYKEGTDKKLNFVEFHCSDLEQRYRDILLDYLKDL